MAPGRGTWRALRAAYLPGLRRTFLLALAANLVLEVAQMFSIGVAHWPWQFKTPTYPLVLLLDTVVLWLVVGLVHAVVGRFRVTATLVLVAAVVVAFADHEKTRFTDEPLYPTDVRFTGDSGFLVDMVGPRALVGLVVALACVVSVVVLAPRFRRRATTSSETSTAATLPLRVRLPVRVLTGLLCLLSLAYLSGFNQPGNSARRTYDAMGAHWMPWSQKRNYLANGFVGGVLFNMRVPAMTKPAGYDAEAMARIASTYTRDAQRINATRDPHGLDHLNVVTVLSESFSDPERIRGVRLAEDPIPYTRRLMRETTSGTMLARNIGGGTANMEFETLTGMSMSQLSPQTGVPYQTLIPGQHDFPSVVGWMKAQGHDAVAIHPFTTEMYRRREVYEAMGFDRFVHDTTMHEHQRLGNNGYISDRSAFDELERQLTEHRKPLFANLVTMQNHMPYEGRYDDPWKVSGPKGDDLEALANYARGIHDTDEALRGLIAWLRHFDEPTVLVFYGDHLPSAYPDDVQDLNGRRMHETPFFVWSNVPGRRTQEPVTSPAHFVDLALQRADAPVSPYYALLQELRQQLPAMDAGMRLDPDGREVSQADLSRRARQLLHDYRLVQYDLAMGHRYSASAMFAPPATGRR
jgi:phosphoglycerol transferase MdoB-like AlkP superfamily enzyme